MSHDPYAPPSTTVADVARAETPARPTPVTVGVCIIAVVWFLNLIGTVFSVYQQSGEMRSTELGSIAFAIALVLAAILFGLLFWFAWLAGKGRNWARIVVTVVVAVGALLVLYGTTTRFAEAPVENAISLAAIVLQVVAVALLYRPRANAWYSAVKEAGV